MGLSDLAYWVGLFCTSMVLLSVDSIIAIACLTLWKDYYTGTRPYFENVNLPLLATVFLMLCCMQTLHAMLISVLFRDGAIAAMFGLVYWLVLMFIGPVLFIEGFTGGLANYVMARPWQKYVSSVTPCVGTYWMLKMLSLFQDYDGYAGWIKLNAYALDLDNVTMLQIMGVMAATFVALSCLIWYLSRVLPWAASAARPFYFPLLPSYWFPSLVIPEDCVDRGPAAREVGVFEPLPKGMKIAMSARGLSKFYGNKVALAKVNLNIYNGQITVLLGHNGSGKTTLMNIFAGAHLLLGAIFLQCSLQLLDRKAAMLISSPGPARGTRRFFAQLPLSEEATKIDEEIQFTAFTYLGMSSTIFQESILIFVIIFFFLHLITCTKRRVSSLWRLSPNVFLGSSARPRKPQKSPENIQFFIRIRRSATLLMSRFALGRTPALSVMFVALACGGILCGILSRSEVPAHISDHCTCTTAVSQVLKTSLVIRRSAAFAPRLAHGACTGVRQRHSLLYTDKAWQIATRSGRRNRKGGAATKDERRAWRRVAARRRETPNVAFSRANKCVSGHRRCKSCALTSRFSKGGSLMLCVCVKHAYARNMRMREPISRKTRPMRMPRWRPAAPLCSDVRNMGRRITRVHQSDHQCVCRVLFCSLIFCSVTSRWASYRTTYLRIYDASATSPWVSFHQVFRSRSTRRVEVWYSAYSDGSQAVVMNLLTTADLRVRTGNPTANITATVVVEALPVERDRDDVDLAAEVIRKTTIFRSFVFPVVTALVVASFAMFPVAERTCQSKALQLMTGLSGSAYWGSNLVFDLIIYWVVWMFAAIVVPQYFDLLINSIRNK
ncbi:unnamed protein product, partial [Ixodes hexagonus]